MNGVHGVRVDDGDLGALNDGCAVMIHPNGQDPSCEGKLDELLLLSFLGLEDPHDSLLR